ncbi:MAG: asparagine synthase-related protein, partial [Planctomycetia bacterium]
MRGDADPGCPAHPERNRPPPSLASLEIRVPFLGRWLVDLVGAIPGSVKAPKGAPPKHLLRKAAGAILPHD